MYAMQITTFIETVNAHEEVALTNWVTGPNFATMLKAAGTKAQALIAEFGPDEDYLYLTVRKYGESTARDYQWSEITNSWLPLNHHIEPPVDDH